MARSTLYELFPTQLEEVIKSDGKLALPNVKPIEDPRKALLAIACSSKMVQPKPYHFRVQDFNPQLNGVQTHQVCWYPEIFLNTAGMGGRFDGTGIILTADSGKVKAYSFSMCEHEWDDSGANHSRGWHPAICKKCGFDASIDSGD